MSPDRNPIQSYEQAIFRIVQWEVSEGYTHDQLSLAVSIVADIFWLSDAKVRHDVKKERLGITQVSHPIRRHYGSAVQSW